MCSVYQVHKWGEVMKLKIGLVCLSTVLTGAVVYANGFRNPPEGARALGRTGGKVAQIDDASAVAVNPANISDLSRPEFVVSLTLVHTKTDFDGVAGGSAQTTDATKFLPNVFATMPMAGGKYVVGVGISTPFGQSTVWEKEGPFKYSAPYFAELRVVNVNPTVAAKLNDRLRVGAGVDVYWSDLKFKQLMPWGMLVHAPVPDGRVTMVGDGTGVGGNAGLTFDLTKDQQLALTYRSPVKVDYDGDVEISHLPGPGLLEPKSDFSTDITFPAVVAAGYGVKLNDKLRVEADVEWIQFSKFDKLPLDLGVNNNAKMFPPAVEEKWDDTWTFGLGAELRVAQHCVARAGWAYLESPVPDETLSPTLPDADRHVFSLGVGYEKNGFSLDAAYAISVYDRSVMSNEPPEVRGDYDTTTHLVAVSIGKTF